MAKLKIKRAVSFVMATVLSLTAFMGVGANTAFAAAGEKTNVYMVDFPRDGDANCDGVWGYNNLTLKNGWHTGSATHTNLKAIGSFSGNVGYCIEPGVHLSMGQSMPLRSLPARKTLSAEVWLCGPRGNMAQVPVCRTLFPMHRKLAIRSVAM